MNKPPRTSGMKTNPIPILTGLPTLNLYLSVEQNGRRRGSQRHQHRWRHKCWLRFWPEWVLQRQEDKHFCINDVIRFLDNLCKKFPSQKQNINRSWTTPSGCFPGCFCESDGRTGKRHPFFKKIIEVVLAAGDGVNLQDDEGENWMFSPQTKNAIPQL